MLAQGGLQRGAFGVGPAAVTAEAAHRRPVGHRRWRRLVVMHLELGRAIDHRAADHRQQRRRVGDLGFGAGEEVAVGDHQVGQLADRDAALLAFLVREPGDVLGPHAQGGLAVQAVALRIQLHAADGLAGDQPGQRHPGVVRGDPCRIGAGRDMHALVQHALDRWRGLGRARPVPLDEIFALVGHAVLHGNAAAERRDAVDRPFGDGLGMVEEPVQAVQRRILVHPLEHVECAADGLVVGGVQPPGPAVLHQDAHHLFQLRLHGVGHVGPGLAEILEVRRREHQHLAGAVVAEVVVTLLVGRAGRPCQEVVLLLLGLLREQVVGQADGQLPGVRELLHHGIVVRVVLEAATGVDGAGHAQAVELAHEVARRVQLVVDRQFRPLGQGGIQDRGVGLGQQQAGRVALPVAHDLAAGRGRRVAVVADRAQRRGIEQGAVVQVQDEHRGVGRGGIELFDGRQPLLGKLMLGEAAHHAHPLRRRRDRDLASEHGHGIGQAAHAVPAQLHVEVQAAADDVQMVVDQARQHAPAPQVDDAGARAGQGHDVVVVADMREAPARDGDGAGAGPGRVERGEAPAVQDHVGVRRISHGVGPPWWRRRGWMRPVAPGRHPGRNAAARRTCGAGPGAAARSRPVTRP